MYETHFGLSGPPFQLNPDPEFYFDSAGHNRALSYLRYGVQQGEGFIVVTGDVGAGKTTLLRALFQELNPDEVVAAQVANTQLDASDLLVSILAAFGVPTEGMGKARAIATLEAFLTQVAASGRRSLLIVDEAQNLGQQAIEELRMLSNFQLGNHGLLQSFLVGQPELREQFQSGAMEQLRQRVLASYHLGPMEPHETAAYVEHRLRHVGWNGYPQIDAQAMAAVHRHAGGIPRRINMLANRVLLAAYLSEVDAIDAALVDQAAQELDEETRVPVKPSAPAPAPASQRSAPAVAEVAARAPVMQVLAEPIPVRPSAPGAVDLSRVSDQGAGRIGLVEGALPDMPVFCIADNPMAWFKLRGLARHWVAEVDLPPMVMVNPGSRLTMQRSWQGQLEAEVSPPEIHLGVGPGPAGQTGAAVAIRFAELMAEGAPSAVVAIGTSYAVLHCALVARQMGVPVVRLEGGMHRQDVEAGLGTLAALIDRSSDLLCVPSSTENQILQAEGYQPSHIVGVGDLTACVLRSLQPALPAYSELLGRLGAPAEWAARAAAGFGLVTAQFQEDDVAPGDALQWLMLARYGSAELPLLWLAGERTAVLMRDPSVRAQLESAGIVVARQADYLQYLGLLARARCVVAGPGRLLVDEATASGVPSIVVQLYADAPAVPENGLVTRVGPSASQFRAAVRAAFSHAPADRSAYLASAAQEAQLEIVEQLARWLPRHAMRSPLPELDEIAA